MSIFAQFLLENVMGYTISPSFSQAFTKQRIGIYPHTSKFESFIVMLALLATNNQAHICFAVSDYYMNIPILGHLLASFGGIFVKKGHSTTAVITQYLKDHKHKCFAISPEGSLDAKEWKSGFFYIARETGIPIIVWGIDFDKHMVLCKLEKEIVIQAREEPTPARMREIKHMFSQSMICPLYPECSYPEIHFSEVAEPCYLPLNGKINTLFFIYGLLWLFNIV